MSLLDQTVNNIISSAKDLFNTSNTSDIGEIELKSIGRPTAFSSTIDSKRTATKYLQSKMNIIDLIPCDFSIDISSFFDSNGSVDLDGGDLSSLIQHKIVYDKPCDRYKKQQAMYNLPKSYAGLRLYVTDETPATDSFTNLFTPSVLYQKINSFSDGFQSLRELIKTGGEGIKNFVSEMQTSVVDTAKKYSTEIANEFNLNGNAIGNNIENALNVISNMALYGHKMPVPLYWQESNYSPSLNVNLKLVSPSGHPVAIKKFIIEPLIYILLLASSKTFDGITYGNAGMCSVYAYGLTQIPAAYITSITLNRGGSTTAFNIFRQPLMIDLNISFDTLVSGFAAYSPDFSNNIKVTNPEENIFTTTDKENTAAAVTSKSRKYIVSETKTLMGTPGKIMESLRPINIYNFSLDNPNNTNNTISNTISDYVNYVSDLIKTSQKIANTNTNANNTATTTSVTTTNNTNTNTNTNSDSKIMNMSISNDNDTNTNNLINPNNVNKSLKNDMNLTKIGDKYEIKLKNGSVAIFTYDELPPSLKKTLNEN